MLQRLHAPVTQPRDDAAAVAIAGLSKRFGHVIAVQDVSIDIEPGSFVSLLGPSGCGKTTVLRSIAGLEQPDEGSIRIGDQVVNDVPVWKRNIGMVFQNYALFPHMSVADNVGFGMRVRGGFSSAEQRSAVGAALEMVRLGVVADRLPRQLSGGQRQRVAIARALITRPRLLLLDEPLGALDRKLREQMQLELKLLQRQVGITTVMVTHDQEEALTLSDRIIVMNAGKVVQAGPPDEVYRHPGNAFIADFIGTSNFFSGDVVGRVGDVASVRLANGTVVEVPGAALTSAGETLSFFIRPENVLLSTGEPPARADAVRGRVLHVAYSGAVSHCYVEIGLPQPVDVLLTNTNRDLQGPSPQAGDDVVLTWAASSVTAVNR